MRELIPLRRRPPFFAEKGQGCEPLSEIVSTPRRDPELDQLLSQTHEVQQQPEPPKRKIWRVPIHGRELMAAGWKADMDPEAGWQMLQDIMVAKGLPVGFTLDRTPVKISPHGKTGLMLEFD